MVVTFIAIALAGCVQSQKNCHYGLEGKSHAAVTPAHRFNWWGGRHEAILERIQKGNVDLIFIGDSITHSWENGGKELWNKYYAPRNAVNMGFLIMVRLTVSVRNWRY